jgi:hypothetical protein
MKGKQGSGGGGIGTRQHVKTPIKSGPSNTKKISVESASAQGAKRGNKFEGGSTPASKAARPPLIERQVPQVVMGNQKALAVGRGAPGADRQIHGSGSQGQHGAPRQAEGQLPNVPSGTGTRTPDLLSQFGPESGGRRR